MQQHSFVVREHAARQKGELDGYLVSCSCGFVSLSSMKTLAENDARAHVAYATTLAVGKSYRAYVAALQSQS